MQLSEQWGTVLTSFQEQAVRSGYSEQLQEALKDPVSVNDNMKKTFIITDKICLQHAGFQNYANVQERVMQKDN